MLHYGWLTLPLLAHTRARRGEDWFLEDTSDLPYEEATDTVWEQFQAGYGYDFVP